MADRDITYGPSCINNGPHWVNRLISNQIHNSTNEFDAFTPSRNLSIFKTDLVRSIKNEVPYKAP
jgi:hypothetical protein